MLPFGVDGYDTLADHDANDGHGLTFTRARFLLFYPIQGTRMPTSPRSLDKLKPHDGIKIAPSILAADFSQLGNEVKGVEIAGADMLHIDIMDGHFVPNLSMGPGIIQSIRKLSSLPFDVHLMLSEPGRYIDPFVEAGADHITIHVESSGDISATIDRIHESGCSAGITLRPGTPAASIKPFIEKVDLILVMTVEPGFGGQSFMNGQIPKIKALRDMIDASGKPIHLQVDGGIATGTARQVVNAGADVLVAGSSIFKYRNDFPKAIQALKEDK